jgi:hypothetical protein
MAVVDRVLSVLVALVLVALGVLIPVEVVHAALGKHGYLVLPYESWARAARDHAWDSTLVMTISAVVAAVGLLLLLVELRPRRPAALALVPLTDGVQVGTDRRSLARALAARTREVDGIAEARARVRRRRADIVATTWLRDPGDLKERAVRHVTDWLDGLGLVAVPAVRLRLRVKEH